MRRYKKKKSPVRYIDTKGALLTQKINNKITQKSRRKLMSLKSLFISYIIILFSSISHSGFAQTLDSKLLIEELESSNKTAFYNYLNIYDKYLSAHPTDVLIHIEKCRFLQNAQYDVEEDTNPNQELFDSCSSDLVKMYPNHPEVLIFQTTYKWGDDLKAVFETAEKSIKENPAKWNDKNIGILYKSISSYHFYNDEYKQAYSAILKAISKDTIYESTIEYAQILHKLNKNDKAIEVLLSVKDTVPVWQLNQKADMLLELKEYSKALDLYKHISKIDSSYNNNYNIAKTLEKVGETDLARECLVTDTAINWQKEASLLNLLKHDIQYQNGAMCIATYNKYRDMGFQTDPLAFYRIKVFLSHPFQLWKFRDLTGLLLFTLAILLLFIIPYIWIIPVYFIGHKWKYISLNKSFESDWGLKSFWFISFGYLFASFLQFFVEPELLYSTFNSSYVEPELSQHQVGLSNMLFMTTLGLFTFVTLHKVNLKVLLTENWTIKKSILLSLGLMIVFKIISGLYIKLGTALFDVDITELAKTPNILLATQQDIQSLIIFSGKGITFIFICLFVPFYEEIIFRGVILGSCQKYTNFHIANFIQATLFAAVHLNLFMFPVFLLFGILTGVIQKKSGGLLGGIVFHIFNNILATILLFM